MVDVSKVHIATALVYIAGVEVPVNEVSVQYGVGQIPQATLVLAADEEIFRLGEEDKVPVAIFYLDQWYSPDGNLKNVEPTFRLLFDGEITGWSYRETVDGDSLVFTATSHVMTLGQMFAKFLGNDVTNDSTDYFDSYNTVQGVITDYYTRTFPMNLLQSGMFTGKAAKTVDRPFDFVKNLLLPLKIGGYPTTEGDPANGKIQAINSDGSYTTAFKNALRDVEGSASITASYYTKFVKQVPQQSAAMNFFVRYCHKTKFDKRWIATPLEAFLEADVFKEPNAIVDPTFNDVMKHLLYLSQMRALETHFGKGDSFLNILLKMYSLFTYEILHLPTAPYVVVGGNGRVDNGVPVENVRITADTIYALGMHISKPVSFFPLAPACNIILPSMASSRSHEEVFAAQVTRTMSGSPFLSDMMPNNEADRASKPLEDRATSRGYPTLLNDALSKGKLSNPNSILIFPEEYYKGPVVQHITMPAWYQQLKEASGEYNKKYKVIQDERNRKKARGEKVDPYDPKSNPDALLRPAKERSAADIYARYVKLKHHEAKYSARRGTEMLAFNPYLVPGYTFVRFAKPGKSMHTMGVIETVSITITNDGSSTSISYGMGRTVKEVAEGVIQEAIDTLANTKKLERIYAMFPTDPVETIANAMQEENAADTYYRRVFFQGTTGKSAVFKFGDYIKTSPFMNGKFRIPSSSPVATKPPKGYAVTIEPREQVEPLMQDYAQAMGRVARPICTLEQYTSFINGGKNVDFSKITMLPASYYGIPVPLKIREYRSRQFGDLSLERHINPTINVSEYANNIFDNRRDWVTRLENYRRRIYEKEIRR